MKNWERIWPLLNRRPKKRYLCILQAGESIDSAKAIKKRFSELFGTIAAEKAAIRLIEQRQNGSIIRCTLEQLENVLLTITLVDPPAVAIAMSGTLRKLRKRTQLSRECQTMPF